MRRRRWRPYAPRFASDLTETGAIQFAEAFLLEVELALQAARGRLVEVLVGVQLLDRAALGFQQATLQRPGRRQRVLLLLLLDVAKAQLVAPTGVADGVVRR